MLSMTGYGKSEVTSGNKKHTVEIRSLNGKSSDISLKSSFLPKDKELEYRQYLTRRLVRGNIDVFLTSEAVSGSEARRINREVFRDYFSQMADIVSSLELDSKEDCMSSVLVSSVLRMPDVVSARTYRLWTGLWRRRWTLLWLSVHGRGMCFGLTCLSVWTI